VQASAEGIYQSLLDDKFFINLNHGFADMLGGLDAFIDGAGGLKNILISIAGIILTNFSHNIPKALDNLKYNITVLTKGAAKAYGTIQAEMEKTTAGHYESPFAPLLWHRVDHHERMVLYSSWDRNMAGYPVDEGRCRSLSNLPVAAHFPREASHGSHSHGTSAFPVS
jgi:hypothetical protein